MRTMERTFRLNLTNTAAGWPEVLEQAPLQRIVDGLQTRRSWQIEDLVEAGDAGWVAGAREGTTSYALSLTVPATHTKGSPPPVIEWTLVAGAMRDDAGRFRIPLVAVILATGLSMAAIAFSLRLDPAWIWIPLAGLFGMFPVGLVLGIIVLQPLVNRRARAPVAGGAAFLREVATVVDQLQSAL